jgi:hypothetical protein
MKIKKGVFNQLEESMNKKIKRTSFWILVMSIMAIALGACKPTAPVEPTLDPDVIFTQAAESVAAQLTRTALSQPTATNTALPSPTLTPTIQLPTATTESNSTNATPELTSQTGTTPNPNKMAFVTDVTIPDGQVIPPGAKFVKTWRLKNTGTTTWTANYRVRLWAGNSFGAPTSFLLAQEVKPNAEVDISIEFTAPSQTGEYISHWILSDDQEANFGNTFYVNFVVGVPASPTATQSEPTPTFTPTP